MTTPVTATWRRREERRSIVELYESVIIGESARPRRRRNPRRMVPTDSSLRTRPREVGRDGKPGLGVKPEQVNEPDGLSPTLAWQAHPRPGDGWSATTNRPRSRASACLQREDYGRESPCGGALRVCSIRVGSSRVKLRVEAVSCEKEERL